MHTNGECFPPLSHPPPVKGWRLNIEITGPRFYPRVRPRCLRAQPLAVSKPALYIICMH